MANFGELVVRLALDATGFSSSLAGAKNDLIKWRDETNANTKEMAKWGAAIGATVAPVIAVGAAAYGTIEKFGGMAQSIKDLSYVTGLSTQRIQELQYAATLSGTNFSSVTAGVQNFTIAISKARDATSDAGKAFATLGVTTSGKTTDQVLEDTFTALVNMKDETERNTIANTLYGRSWREMLPYMEAYIKNAKEIKANPYLSDEELNTLESSKTKLDAFGSKLTIFEAQAVSLGETAATRAVNGWDIWSAAIKLDIHGVEKAMSDMNEQSNKAKQIARDAADKTMDLSKSGAGITFIPGAVLNPETGQVIEQQKQSVPELTDKYAGLNDTQIDLITTTDLLTEAEENRNKATNQADFDKYSAEIQKYKNRIDELNASLEKSATATKSAVGAWSETAVIGSAGSEMASFMKDELAHGADYQTALNAWSIGVHSYARVGGDFGTLGAANDSSAFLAAGGSQAQWDLIYGNTKSSGSGAAGKTTWIGTTDSSKAVTGTDSKKTLSLAEQATLDTKTLSTELKKQEDLFSGLNDKIKAGWIALERDGLVHWTALSELSRIAEQAIMENAYQAASYAGKTPIIQKIVMLSKSGYDIDPSAISVAGPITLAAADFSGVKFLGEDKGKSGSGGGLGAPDIGKTQVNVTVINTGKDIDSIVKADSDDTAISVVSQTGGTS